jgi:hypothetical protein
MRNYFKGTSFLDLLFNILLLFFAMFILSYTQIRLDTSKAETEQKAEFVITLTWDSNSTDDIDLWIKDPLGEVIFFRQKKKGMTHLDRDDRGDVEDTIVLPSGQKVRCAFNQEIVTIRGIIPGEWIINLHMYSKRTSESTNVEVKMVKLNPSFSEIFTKKLTMTNHGQEVTISRFTLDISGNVLSMDELPASLVNTMLGERNH